MSEAITLVYKPDPTGELSGIEKVFKVEMSISVTISLEILAAAHAIVKYTYKGGAIGDYIKLLRALCPCVSAQAAKMAIEYAIKEALQNC